MIRTRSTAEDGSAGRVWTEGCACQWFSRSSIFVSRRLSAEAYLEFCVIRSACTPIQVGRWQTDSKCITFLAYWVPQHVQENVMQTAIRIGMRQEFDNADINEMYRLRARVFHGRL